MGIGIFGISGGIHGITCWVVGGREGLRRGLATGWSRAPFVLRTFPPRSGGNPAAPGHTPAFLCRSLGLRVPFRWAKGDGGVSIIEMLR